MKIDILFSNNKKIGSKIISYGSSFLVKNMEHVPSHTAILINDTLVVESVMLGGVRIIPYNNWINKNNLIARFSLSDIQNKTEIPSETFRELIEEMWGKRYDFLGLLFFGYCVLRYMIFKISLPNKNEFEQENKFFCSEFVGRLVGYNYSMKSPAQMLSDFNTLMEKHGKD